MWGISSAVEHFVDIEGVTSSILVSPTMNSPPRSARNAGTRKHRRWSAPRQIGEYDESQELTSLAEEPAS